ncbi:MAG: hypothetical protein JXM79_12930 [Sedimentisphaerales bacterium]|nr:hypothetical protein [Sedimentisphaerales bacterium]
MPATKVKAKKQTSEATVNAKKHISVTKVEKKQMTLPEIRMKAKALGLTPGRMKKADLIHTIQVAEGYTPCFGHSNGSCGYADCCFMDDCLKVKS